MTYIQHSIVNIAKRLITLLYIENKVVNNEFALLNQINTIYLLTRKMPESPEKDAIIFETLINIYDIDSFTPEKRAEIESYSKYLMGGNNDKTA